MASTNRTRFLILGREPAEPSANPREDKTSLIFSVPHRAGRKYFGRRAQTKPLTGHHLGIYGQAFTYDFETGHKGYIGGKPGGTLWDKLNYAIGVEYGYSLPISRRLNLDFTLGVGYWGGEYHEYIPSDGHYVWQSTKQRHWFGPTKAEVSLIWLIGRGNYNEKKGGKR